MAPSAFSVQPHVAQAQEAAGAIARHAAAILRPLIEQFTNFSGAREGFSDRELKQLRRAACTRRAFSKPVPIQAREGGPRG